MMKKKKFLLSVKKKSANTFLAIKRVKLCIKLCRVYLEQRSWLPANYEEQPACFSKGDISMDWFVGAALVIIIFISSSTIEKTLKAIKVQNDTIIELLRENNKK